MARVVQLQNDAAPVETCFFFGTLMHPKILQRVIGNDGTHLTTEDALLRGYTRHKVRQATYPAILPAKQGAKILKRQLTDDEACVRGTLVTGLSAADLEFLDEFEGDEYARDVVEVERVDGRPPLRAWAYVWDSVLRRLAPSIWTFEEFRRDHLSDWVSSDEEYTEVDRRRAMNGHVTPIETEILGRAARDKFWQFRPGWRNLNQGSYGSCPKPVLEAFRQWQDDIEAAPDIFFRKTLADIWTSARSSMASLMNCDVEEMMLVPNTTTAIDSIFRSLRWTIGDAILIMSTIYAPCRNIIRNLIDSRQGLRLRLIEVRLEYPLSDEKVLSLVDEAIKGTDGTIRLALFDAISSVPAVRVPWERLVERMRASRILSLVDGAHALGTIPLDLRRVDPDFFVTNLHKHFYAHRPCAAFYVPRRNQPLVHSLPVGFTYEPAPTSKMPLPSSSLVAEWAWTSTQDWLSVCSIPATFRFRAQLGGEEAIMRYTHDLARRGGAEVANLLGTDVMENAETTLTTSMVNVRLPITVPRNQDDQHALATAMRGTLLAEHETSIQVFAHNDALWARFTATCYLAMEDFVYGANALKRVCAEVSATK